MANRNDTARVRATVKYFNGILGRAEDASGTEYKLHIGRVRPEFREQARTELREGCIIEFTPAATDSWPRAKDISVVECPALPAPTGLSVGYWETVRGHRCSACGQASSEEHMWCPCCGAKMYSKDVYDIVLEETVRMPAADCTEIEKSTQPAETWDAVCRLFGADPETTGRLSISHAIIRARQE